MTTGVLLTNLGTPASPQVGDVRRYLRQFLSDPRVLDLHPVGRWFLLNLVILPLRPRKSAHAYQSIWTDAGSPLLVHSRALVDAVAQRLGPATPVALGMRYGEPSLGDGIEKLRRAGATRLVVLPLYPQYAASTVASTEDELFRVLGRAWDLPPVQVLPAFFDAPEFVGAVAGVARRALASATPDHVLMSFHGLPERHVRKSDPSGNHCLASPGCCDRLGSANAGCYRAQSFATARAVAAELGLEGNQWSVAFQSRLGRDAWIGPSTEDRLRELGSTRGSLAVLCPSFTADCLETLEEIGIRGREVFTQAGGGAFASIPCVNDDPAWVDGVVRMLARAGVEAQA